MQLRTKINNLITALLLLLTTAGNLTAQEFSHEQLPDPEAFRVKLIYWTNALNQVEKNHESLDLSLDDKNNTIRTITFIREDALVSVAENKAIIAQTKPSEEGKTQGESGIKFWGNTEEPTTETKQLRILSNSELNILSRQISQANSIAERSRIILEDLGAIVPSSRWSYLFERSPSPLAPSVVVVSIPEILSLTAKLLLAPSEWIADGRLEALWQALLTRFFIGLIASIAIAWLFRNWLLRRYGRDEDNLQPSYSRRLVATIIEAIGRGLLPAILIIVVVVTIDSLGLLSGLFRDMVTAIALNLVLFVAVEALSRAALAPNYSAWRMTPFDDVSSRLLNRRITLLVAVVTIVESLADMTVNVEISESLISFLSGLSGVALACFMLPLLQQKAWRWKHYEQEITSEEAQAHPSEIGKDAKGKLPVWMKVRLVLSVIIILAATIGIFGYINLTKFILSSIIQTGVLLAIFSLIRSLTQELIAMGLERGLEPAHWFTTLTGIKRQNHDTIQNITLNILDGFLLILSALVLLAIWGVPPERVGGWLSNAMSGISIGSYVFSLTDTLLAIAAFSIILLITRAIQWLLDTRLLPKRLDLGIRQSIRLVAGYIGVILALMVAVSTLGIDLSSIALVAGALSVGIGFGLQAVVGNFISGLILLFERPIKPGDWIVVGEQEGFVTRISVRSTELRTFQRATVIIPNSDVLSKAVTNWTHKDSNGRVDILVGVDYEADPEMAADIMRQCGEEHPLVLKFPKPRVLFMNFGDSSQDLELRVMISEIDRQYEVASDLRFAIRKAFDAAGVVIPFPQRVVHLVSDKPKEIS
ncbi:MAG: mechanosensitive ion channel family protein [Rhodospirillales bacterium]|jgi:potassium-dependent mechanosensitive channel|nr:mechanosensitive ion channel family protein [Rhodospirillales bacterium]